MTAISRRPAPYLVVAATVAALAGVVGVLLARGGESTDRAETNSADTNFPASTTILPAATDGPRVEDLPPASTTILPAATDGPRVEDLPPASDRPGTARWTVEILEWFPHDPTAFTQGLETADGVLYESTGLYGRSSLRVVDMATGTVISQATVADNLFAEGLTVVGDRIVQLTWKAGRALVYDRTTLTPIDEFSYEGEGWGLCRSGGVLIMSDGSDRLAQRNPESFELIDHVTVTAANPGITVDHLNELECVDGLVIANVWLTSELLVIDPAVGLVVATIDGQALIDDVRAAAGPVEIDVLNGVAALDDGTFLMSGKLWPRMYRVRLLESPRDQD